MEDNKKIIEVLNDLIKINEDRITGYEKAASNLENSEVMLKSLFYQISDESQEINNRLTDKVIELGGEPANDYTIPGKIYQLWMDIKATFAGRDSSANSSLEACEFGEDAAQRAYKEAVAESKDFPEPIRHMIKNQQHLLKMAHDLIRNQRNQNHEMAN
jgi:uncharacterized protein (TIGR02284 family)